MKPGEEAVHDPEKVREARLEVQFMQKKRLWDVVSWPRMPAKREWARCPGQSRVSVASSISCCTDSARRRRRGKTSIC